jgi:PAS domain S-box-containing protein
MAHRLTYEELEQRVKELERQLVERKHLEKALRESEEQFKSLAELSPNMIFINSMGKVVYANKRCEELTGYTKEEFYSPDFSYLSITAPEHRDLMKENFKKHSEENEVPSSDYAILTEEGKRIEGIISTRLITYRGTPAILGTVTDITERKRIEEALEASEERYRAVVENQTELICRFLTEGTLTFVNEAYCRYFGKKREDLVGSQFMPLIPEEDRGKVEAHFSSITPHAPVATHEHRVVAGDGAVRWHQWTNQGIFDDQGYILEYQSVGRDITEQRKVGKQLARVEKLESLGILAGGIAHDFNNLLTPILSNISMARTFGELGSEVTEMLVDAEKATLRAKSLTQQLLTFSKGGVPVKRVASISKLLEDASKFALSGSNVNCEYFVPEDLWPVEMDEGQIAQVIQNLIINADQATPRGGKIEIRAENVIISEKDGLPLEDDKHVRVSIIDRGIGISKKDMANIFDPFFTTKQRGSGLGLSTSFTIVEQHKGTIQVESKLGVGSTFYVYLPASSERPAIEERGGEEARTGQGRILIVDDNEAVRRALGRVLRRLGYEARFAEDGAEAIRVYEKAMKEERSFDVVITDLTIPGGMGGQEIIKNLKRINPEAKVIVSSGYSEDLVLSNFQGHGFCGVLTKPYDVGDLAEAVRQVLDGARG